MNPWWVLDAATALLVLVAVFVLTGVVDGLTYGGLIKKPWWKKLRYSLWRNVW
jgi:hypothetical protein